MTAAAVAVGLGWTVAPLGTVHAAETALGSSAELAPVDGDTTIDADWGDDSTREGRQAAGTTGAWVARGDLGSLASVTSQVGAQAAWRAGATGKGVTVAVIDTGVAPVPGLDDKGKVINGPDLSFDGQSPDTAYSDSFGHGTHMAGIIAGADDKFDPKQPSDALFAGVAPQAELLNMKVGTGDGGADVSQIIAALDWVVQNRREHGMNVRVVSLAYGTESTQSWQVDPLAKAVENAWNNGIVVVTSAGNDGLAAPSLLMPAVDPHVIAVGAVDHRGTATSADDVVADFTNGGNQTRRPDVLAPGKSVVSLRVPGSYVDEAHPEGLVFGDEQQRYFRGSGTSQATAVVAGEAALLLAERPSLTPDQVKWLLARTARPLQQNPHPAMGAGVTDVGAAVALLQAKAPVGTAVSTAPASTGTGSLQASRGGEYVVDPETGATLTGEVDALGAPFDSQAWATASTRGVSWLKGAWNGRVWAGDKFAHDDWVSAQWTGHSWNGKPWAAHDFGDRAWKARSWRADSWKARSWRADNWKARSWRADSWKARSWRSVGD
ncbi:MAG: S8 family serine peptidase [Nocardioidaceae bacterium]